MSTQHRYPWIPDQRDGTYRNPVLHADYSDPDVIRHGADFWMISSSFNCTPAIPILHSHDLVNWTLVNHAVRQLPHPRYAVVQPGCGVWAPAIRFHAGKLWIFFPMPDEGIYVTSATDPAGEWSEPWLLQEALGWIDPCPFWDEDGKAYLIHAYANSRAGKKERLHIRPMSPDCRKLLGEGQEVIHTPHHAFLEGPKVHKLDGWYYILAPGGGVSSGWQVAFRSRSLWGPYDEKIVLEQGCTPINGPHQGALIDTPCGEWWFVHFQDTGPFGRIVHLQPVSWRDGWPHMGVDYDGNGVGEPVARWKKPSIGKEAMVAVPATTDEFEAGRLGLPWQWHANHRNDWASLAERPGWLRLHSQPAPDCQLNLLPNFLGQKFPAREFQVEALLDFGGGRPGEIAGLAVVSGQQCAALALRKTQSETELIFIENGAVEVAGPTTSSILRLAAKVTEDGTCTFLSAAPGAALPAWPRSVQVKAGGWLGSKIGLCSFSAANLEAPGGYADFDYFRFSGGDEPMVVQGG